MSSRSRFNLEHFLVKQGVEFSPKETNAKWKIQRIWREKFARTTKEATGKWAINDRDWHTFSYGYAQSLRGARAESAYAEALAEHFILASSNEEIPFYQCRANNLPESDLLQRLIEENPALLDIYVFPLDLEWTMVFTHETNIGPFFAWAESI